MTKPAVGILKQKAAKEVSNLRMRGHRVGRVVEFRDGGWLVSFAERANPIAARTTLSNLSEDEMRAAALAHCEALIVFESELPDRPIVVGLLAQPKTGLEVSEAEAGQIDARVDGRRVTLDARDEIVLRCGEASITLRRNGRIVVRGTYVETRARGVNRIKGGSVQIN
jgi:uncharacterized protein DUF6484